MCIYDKDHISALKIKNTSESPVGGLRIFAGLCL